VIDICLKDGSTIVSSNLKAVKLAAQPHREENKNGLPTAGPLPLVDLNRRAENASDVPATSVRAKF